MANNKATRITYINTIVNAYNRQGEWNGGWHKDGKRAYRKARKTLTQCLLTYERPRLYHLGFKGQSVKVYKDLLQALRQHLVSKGAPCEWWGAVEEDEASGKHMHVFLVVDAKKARTHKIFQVDEERFLGREAAKRGIRPYVNPPRNAMHNGCYHIELPWQGSSRETSAEANERLEDALVWLTYLYKARSKPVNAEGGQIFPTSRPNRKRSDTPSLKIPGTKRSGIPAPYSLVC